MQAVILKFPTQISPDTWRDSGVPKERQFAQILIFPGVQRERYAVLRNREKIESPD